MATTIADIIVRTGNVSLGLAQSMLTDVTPEIFARKPSFDTAQGVKVIDTNHPAFVYGHLGCYPAMIAELIGANIPATQTPPGLKDHCAAGKECRDDPAGEIYPPMAAVTSHFFASYKALLAEIAKVDDAKMLAPNPREGRMKDLFPTVGAMIQFMLSSHIMLHLGQISAWRRCMGLGPAPMG